MRKITFLLVAIFMATAFGMTSPVLSQAGLGDVYVALSNGVQFVGTGNLWHGDFCFGEEVCAVGDVNGDGKDDIITFSRNYYADDPGRVGVALSNGTNAFVGTGVLWHDEFCVGDEICAVGDVNGDGKDDLIAFSRNHYPDDPGLVWVALSNGTNAFVGTGVLWHEEFCVGTEVCAVGDVNGDNKDDIIAFSRDYYPDDPGLVWVALSDGVSEFVGTGVLWHEDFCLGSEICGVGDVNGDGKDDIIAFSRDYYPDDSGRVWVALSNGTQFVGTGMEWHNNFCMGDEICAVGDVNGDNKDDLIAFSRDYYPDDPGKVWIAISNGTQFVGTGAKWHDYFCVGDEVCAVGDVNGDGMDDIITFTR